MDRFKKLPAIYHRLLMLICILQLMCLCIFFTLEHLANQAMDKTGIGGNTLFQSYTDEANRSLIVISVLWIFGVVFAGVLYWGSAKQLNTRLRILELFSAVFAAPAFSALCFGLLILFKLN
jgi:hypothetical protein